MLVGVPREIKVAERRVALTPSGAAASARGNTPAGAASLLCRLADCTRLT